MGGSDRKECSRREFVGAAAAVPLAVGAGDSPQTARSVDVVVVGAGLGGLTAARDLRRHGLRVCVVEARDRVGGRTLDHPIGGGHVVEGGGQWAGPTQTAVLGIARELGIETFKSHTAGKMVVFGEKTRLTISSGESHGSADLNRVKALLDAMAREVPLAEPWKAPRAAEWDRTTIGAWLKKNAKRSETRDEIGLEVETALGPAARTSLLWFLFYVRSAGGLHALNVEAQELRFRGGSQSISKKLAADLGGDLLLSSPVTRIDQSGDAVTVEAAKARLTARRVVVAMMPADTRRIAFHPELPVARLELAKRWVAEAGIKVNVVYPTPFWRAAGLSGLAVSDRGPVGVTFDNSPFDASRGVLVCFLDAKKTPKDPRSRRTAVVNDLVALVGEGAKRPSTYVETDWAADGWSTGCVSPLPPGVTTQFGSAIRTPVGRIHWAGTETAEKWCGYMDGAVRSGQRVADEVRKAL